MKRFLVSVMTAFLLSASVYAAERVSFFKDSVSLVIPEDWKTVEEKDSVSFSPEEEDWQIILTEPTLMEEGQTAKTVAQEIVKGTKEEEDVKTLKVIGENEGEILGYKSYDIAMYTVYKDGNEMIIGHSILTFKNVFFAISLVNPLENAEEISKKAITITGTLKIDEEKLITYAEEDAEEDEEEEDED